MRKTKDIVVKGIIFSLIPALCNFLGSTDAFLWAQKRERLRDQAVEAHHPVAKVKMESTNLKYREIEKF